MVNQFIFAFNSRILHKHLRKQSKLFSFYDEKSAEIDKMFKKRPSYSSQPAKPESSEQFALGYLLNVYHDLTDLAKFLDKSLGEVKMAGQEKLNATVDFILTELRHKKR
jgi:hypothetical protein